MADEKKVIEDLKEVRRAMDKLVRRSSSTKTAAVRLPTEDTPPPKTPPPDDTK